MKFYIHWSEDKTGSLIDSLVTRKSLKLEDDMSNQYILSSILSNFLVTL